MTNIDRIIELTELLNKYRDSYYNHGTSMVDDKVYDKLFDELDTLEKEENFCLVNSPLHTVGYQVVDELNSVKHNHPMLSLDKTQDVKELMKFINHKKCVMSFKEDGLTCSVRYNNGELVSAETRGDGVVGTDVLFNAKTIKNLPQKIKYPYELIIDGECIINTDDFAKINENLPDEDKYATCRNLAAGSLSQLDSSITATRCLKFIPWRVITKLDFSKSVNYNSFENTIAFIAELGFDIVPYTVMDKDITEKEVQFKLTEMKKLAEDLHHPIDGMVVAYDDMAYGESLGNTGHHPRHSYAFKYEDEKKKTKLKYIEWSVGRTGVIVPTAVFDTVKLDNTDVSRALLHNLTIMKELHITNNCTVNVKKCNMIIPQIESANDDGEGEVKIPMACPSCGSILLHRTSETGTEILVCENKECPAKMLAKFTHFVSKPAMNIDGLSQSTLEKFIGEGFIKNYRDIYHLDKYKDQIIKMDGFGVKSYDKLIKAIENSRNVKLENYLVALGIDNIGKTASKTISKHFHGDYEGFLFACKGKFDFTILDDFGKIMNDSIYKWFNTEPNENNLEYYIQNEMYFIEEKEKEIIQNNFINNKAFCVTGAFKTKKRSEIEAIITERGGKLTGSVSKATNFLLTNEADSGSSKAIKAKELGTLIMTEEEFLSKI